MKKIIFLVVIGLVFIIFINLVKDRAVLTKEESEPEVKYSIPDKPVTNVPELDKLPAKEDWEVREEYKKDGKVLLNVHSAQSLVAGKPFGYLFSFTEPFETFKGKKIAIHAYHKETDEKLTVVSPKTVNNPSPGYSNLKRFTANFEVPEGGLWRYEVVLNDEFYADVVLSVKEK
ncbi:hypothetical protein [Alkalihalobacillus sp. TS-13]|uniref:hypothetical protein n=1 Tax=Alkalihalobacillus sp. TS-13 TaxID=2842455 RepID=UPI001C86FD52|nr:hypothetical protein [Alkalihalobacillus sp. TS-13]